MIECCCCSRDTGHDRAGCGAADSLRSAARRLLAAWASVVRSPPTPHSLELIRSCSSSNLPLHCGHRGHDVHRDGMVNLDRAHCVIQCVPFEHTASPCPPPLLRTSSHPPSARAILAPPQHASTHTWTCTHAHTHAHALTRCRHRAARAGCVFTHTRTPAGLSATGALFSAARCALFSTGPGGKRNHKPTNSQHTTEQQTPIETPTTMSEP